MADIRLARIDKRYDNGFHAVRGIDLHIADREFMVLVGPSGCGKTTSLRMIAGLEQVTAGDILIGDRRVNEVEPKDRDIAFVFQNYALYPHMTVWENMAYALRLRKMPQAEIDAKVDEAAKLLGLTEQLGKTPKQLSGGQRQRVALGRAIVRHPKVFLFDEPLSNLDAKLRGEMRYELRTLQQRLQTTMVYVTHDQVEAMTLGDRITVMNKGAIQQVGAPTSIYDHPWNRFVAGFLGTPTMNFVAGVTADGGRSLRLEGGAVVPTPALATRTLAADGRRVVLGFRPEDLSTATAAASVGRLELRVALVEAMGDHQLVYLAGLPLERPLVMRTESHQRVVQGATLTVGIDMAKAHVFAGADEDAPNLCLPDGFAQVQGPTRHD